MGAEVGKGGVFLVGHAVPSGWSDCGATLAIVARKIAL
jgi:hypothetical protein